jgi:hypothetical protein
MDDKLSEEGFFKYKNDIRTEALSLAIGVLELSADLETAKNALTKVRDSYALTSWPFVRDESTDHQL